MCVCVCLWVCTRQYLWQVDVAVLLREVHFVLPWAQQTPAGEDRNCNVQVVVAGGGVLLDENQVAHHHCIGL